MKPYQYIDFNKLEFSELTEFLTARHHINARQLMGLITRFFSGTEGSKPQYQELRSQYYNLSDVLTAHLHKEEHILFPFIKKLADKHVTGGMTLSLPLTGNSIKLLEEEHAKINRLFHKLRLITSSYTAPSGAPSSLLLCFAALYDLEQNYLYHVSFENQFLFPRLQSETTSVTDMPEAYE